MIALIVTLVVLGLVLYLLETYVPMSPPITAIIRVVVILLSVLIILRAFGIVDIPIR